MADRQRVHTVHLSALSALPPTVSNSPSSASAFHPLRHVQILWPVRRGPASSIVVGKLPVRGSVSDSFAAPASVSVPAIGAVMYPEAECS
ncbi:hypothetical protein KC351_g56 [Hortaea werneckii]|nr:hypothetical protein KC351_g56 [Hortaea werneckii]